VSGIPAIRRPRTANVREDWSAWLPNETAQLFEHLRDELAVSCSILGVIVHEALASSPSGECAPSPQLALLFAGLFDRLVGQLNAVLNALEAHRRQHEILPNVASLRPEHFRSQQARQVARVSQIRSRLLVTRRSVFTAKLNDLRKIVTGLQAQVRELACEIAIGAPSESQRRWIRLEVLQYDLNTCLQETIVVLKSFFCALPGNELP